MICWLAKFRPDVPCDGRLIRAHLIPRQLLKREGYASLVDDPRTWVPACGGPTGCSGHHGMLDTARTLRVPFSALPAGLHDLAAELGLSWWLERTYLPTEGKTSRLLSRDAGLPRKETV